MSRMQTSKRPLPSGAINPRRALSACLMLAVFIAGLVGVVVALSVGHPAVGVSVALIVFGLIAAAATC